MESTGEFTMIAPFDVYADLVVTCRQAPFYTPYAVYW